MTEYHGWKRWATWNVYTWLSNLDAQYGGLMEQAKELLEKYEDEDCSAGVLAESLKLTVCETENPLVDESSLYNDLLGAALDEVDWVAIAHHFVGEAIYELHPDEEWELEDEEVEA